MALWSNTDANTSAPKFAVAGGLGVSADGNTLFENETIDAYVGDAAVGVFGVTTAEKSSETSAQHAGWVIKKQGTGPVVSISANTGAFSPDGNVYITFTGGGTGNTTANAQITTNGSKQIIGITVNSGGEYLTAPTAAAVNANAAFTITMGGRAGRVQSETLVAMGSIS
jgi:hypothetical protein